MKEEQFGVFAELFLFLCCSIVLALAQFTLYFRHSWKKIS